MRNISIKILILIMFATGMVQLDIVALEWGVFRVAQALHIVSSLIILLFFILPFVRGHVYNYFVLQKIKSIDGWLLLTTIFLLALSGFYLFFIGNRGGDRVGEIAFYFHQYGSFALLPFFLYHIRGGVAALLLTITFYSPQLHSSTQNLALLKTDTATSKYHNEDWTSSVKCKSCHSEIFNQWGNSNHRHMAGSNPYYMVMETLAGEVEGQAFRKWCMGCHNPSALTTGHTKTTHEMEGNFIKGDMFEKESKTLQENFEARGNFRLEEGVSCVACHTINAAEAKGNASYSLALQSRKKYLFEESGSSVGRYMSEKLINSKPDVHKKSYSNPLYKESRYCASCHDEFHPVNGIKIVSTFQEWEKSPFNNPNDKTKHKTCIDCHMTNLQNGKFSPYKGRSTEGGEIKNDVKVHYFAGSNHFLAGLKSKTNGDQILQLLKTSAKLEVYLKDGKLLVGVTNIGAGHHLPTGVSDFRELWLDVTLKDKNGRILLSSGKLKKDGNLEEGSRIFQKVFGDEEGKPVGLLFWKYKKLLSDTRIPAGQQRIETYEIGKKVLYPLSATVKLKFRIYPQWATDAVKKVYPQLSDPTVVELITLTKEFK